MLRDVSINMNNDDKMEYEVNTVDKVSGEGYFNAADFINLNNSLDLDLKRNDLVYKRSSRPREGDDGP